MTNDEALYHYNRMRELFPSMPATEEHYPKLFQYYVVLYKHYYMVDAHKTP